MNDAQNTNNNRMLSPIEFIKEYTNQHPELAKFGLLAIFIGCVLVVLYQLGIDLQSNTPSLIYYAAIVFGYIVISRIVESESLMNLCANSAVVGLLIWVVCAILSNSFLYISKKDHLNETLRTGLACLTAIIIPCQETIDNIAKRINRENKEKLNKDTDIVPHVPPISSSPDPNNRTDSPPNISVKPFGGGLSNPDANGSSEVVTPVTYKNPVFMQFGGSIVRDDTKKLMQDLTKIGWNMQGVSLGGERTAKAAGLRVVRYAPDVDKKIAEQLAQHLSLSPLISKGMTTERNNLVKAGTLEIWISD